MNEPKLAMGFIETVGLVTAIAAADAALKSANVTLIGRENSRGDGMITLKIAGNVGAVKAAIAAASAEGSKVGTIASTNMIARPVSGFGAIMSFNEDTTAVSSWLDAVAPGLAPGKVKSINGQPSTGNIDLWEAEKLLKETEKAKKKPVRRKHLAGVKNATTINKDKKDGKSKKLDSEGSTEFVQKKTSRRRKKPARQPSVRKTDRKVAEPDIKEAKTGVKEGSSENKSDKSLTE